MQKQENCFRNNSLAEVFHKFTLLKTRVLIRRLRNTFRWKGQLKIESMLKSIDTLDNHYGISRDVIKDLGGMVL